MVSHHLTFINHGLSVVSVKLSVDEEHFCLSGLTNGGDGFTTLQPAGSVHVRLCQQKPEYYCCMT